MSRYLVTGGLGFIGSHLVDALIAGGHSVRIIEDLSTGTRDHLNPVAELIVADIRTPGIISNGLNGVDGCFHLAAVASVMKCNENWYQCHSVNLGATVALFEESARRGIPVVYASSAAVYGDNPNVPLKEAEPVAPRSPYGVDKAACEMHAKVGAVVNGLRSIGLRFFNVHGPRQRPDDAYAGVITIFRERIQHGQEIVIFGDGRQTRDFIHVRDVVRGSLAAMHRLHANDDRGFAEIFNLCTGHEITIDDLARLMMAEARRTVPVRYVEARAGEIIRSAGDASRARARLNWDARPIEKTLAPSVGAESD